MRSAFRLAAHSTAAGSGSTNRLTRTPISRIWLTARRISSAGVSGDHPASLVISPGLTGTRVHWCGRTSATSAKSSGRKSPSMLYSTRSRKGRSAAAISRTSWGVTWRRSARGCTVMPGAPAARHVRTASITLGTFPPREFRSVATLFTLTLKRTIACSSIQRSGGLLRHFLRFHKINPHAAIRESLGDAGQLRRLEFPQRLFARAGVYPTHVQLSQQFQSFVVGHRGAIKPVDAAGKLVDVRRDRPMCQCESAGNVFGHAVARCQCAQNDIRLPRVAAEPEMRFVLSFADVVIGKIGQVARDLHQPDRAADRIDADERRYEHRPPPASSAAGRHLEWTECRGPQNEHC